MKVEIKGGPRETKWKYTNAQMVIQNADGKKDFYVRCDACRKWHQGDYGYVYSYDSPPYSGDGKVKLCEECAYEFGVKWQAFQFLLWNMKEDTPKEPRTDDDPFGLDSLTEMIKQKEREKGDEDDGHAERDRDTAERV